MPNISNLEEAKQIAEFSQNLDDFKTALRNSKAWAVNLLNLTDGLQANPYYAEFLSEETRASIQLCEDSSKRAVELLEQVEASIASLD